MAILPKSSITELDKWHIENIMYMLKSTINYIKAHTEVKLSSAPPYLIAAALNV